MPELTPDPLPCEIDGRIDPSLVTALAGVPLVIELFRRVGAAQVVNEQVWIKQRQRGGARAVGGDADRTVDGRQGPLSGPHDAARRCRAGRLAGLCAARGQHDARPLGGVSCRDAPVAARRQEDGRSRGVRAPGWGGAANRRILATVQGQAPQATATLDVAATILEAHTRTATVADDGTTGYQPVVVVWAEQDLVVHDEFRDGNVPAGCGNVRILERAVAAVPAGVEQRFAVRPAQTTDLHRPRLPRRHLDRILCLKTNRALRRDWTVAHNGHLYQIHDNVRTTHVTVEERLDGTLRLTHHGRALAFHMIAARPAPVAEAAPLPRASRPVTPTPTHPWRKWRRQEQGARPAVARP